MPVLLTQNFGEIEYQPASVLTFPAGLPGFEDRSKFLPVSLEQTAPVVYLHSLEDPALCFITLPVGAVDPSYRLRMSDEDLELLGLPAGHQPRIGADLLCLVIVAIKEDGPTVNLLAPVVINLANQLAVQAIASASEYSLECPLLPVEEPVCS